MAITATKELNRLVNLAVRVGCPQDQLSRFLQAGYVPQPKQLELHAAAREADNEAGPEWIGFGGARGPGKSHATFAQVCLDDCQRFDGIKVLFLRKVGKAAKESLEDLRERVLFATPHTYLKNPPTIHFPNGSRVLVGHFQNESDIDAYLGLEYDLIVIEEATTLTFAKFQRILGSLRTSKAGWRPRLYLTTNPGGVGHAWFKKIFVDPWRKGVETLTRFIPAVVYDNRFVNSGFVRYLEGLSGWLKRAWLGGDWDIAAGQFFTNFNYDLHVIKPFEIPDGVLMWCALDYGQTHYTVVYLMALMENTIYFVDEYAAQRTLIPQQAAAIKSMLANHRRSVFDLWQFVAGADVFAKRGDQGESIADHYARNGIDLTAANMDRVQGAAQILHRLGDPANGSPVRLQIFETCHRLIECLPMLEHDPHRPEDVLKVDTDENGVGGDDPYDAARYGVMALASAAVAQSGPNPFANYRG